MRVQWTTPGLLVVLSHVGLARRLSARSGHLAEEHDSQVAEHLMLGSHNSPALTIARKSTVPTPVALFLRSFGPSSAFQALSGTRSKQLVLANAIIDLGACLPTAGNSEAQRVKPVEMMGRKAFNNRDKVAASNAASSKNGAYIGKKVVNAVKSGGADPDNNSALAAVMREANALNVDKGVIDRALKKALDPNTEEAKELTYEAYGHGGVGLIINVFADNHKRAATKVQDLVNKKCGCKMATEGSVLFNYALKGRLTLKKTISEDDLIETAIEAGCNGDVSIEEPDPDDRGDGEDVECVVLTDPKELELLRTALEGADYEVAGKLVHIPLATIELDDDAREKNYNAIDKLEELDDVTSVEHNME